MYIYDDQPGSPNQIKTARRVAILRARQLLNADFIMLKTRPGGAEQAQTAAEIAILNSEGGTLLHSNVKIDTQYCKTGPEGPLWSDLHDGVMQLIAGRKVAGWDIAGDMCIIRMSAFQNECYLPILHEQQGVCVKEMYAMFVAKWDYSNGLWKQELLSGAAECFGIAVPEERTALDDCKIALEVVKNIAEKKAE